MSSRDRDPSDDPVATGVVGRLVRGDVAWPRVLLGAVLVALVVALLALGATSTSAFGIYNPAWDGTSEFRQSVAAEEGTDLTVVRDAAAYDSLDPDETVAFVSAPDESYTGDDAARVREFVETGGTLVVSENFASPGNDLLSAVGAESRVDGRLLRDERAYANGPAMPIATNVTDSAATGGASQLSLNYATAVDPGSNATVLARTSPYAYLGDADANLSAVELDSYPVAAVESVGEGSVVTVGDPSIAINAMIDEPDNRAFLTGLSDDADTVVVDVSHAERLPPLRAAVLTIRASPALGLGLGLVGIAAIAGAATRRPWLWLRSRLPSRRRPSADAADRALSAVGDEEAIAAARAEALRERHPDWDAERVQRVITALNRTRRNERDDE
ncbi:DUF4350 domain-containing protein [Halovivax cerinus]|uniref:DUF4350 domain-containing protein n=1 Tax=Halovivax cerinus TaxID=1487865 RepID=A0ABD5NQ25_9EURY|nr:DUF4350 domain-containing protein [Halovivax cerinus]